MASGVPILEGLNITRETAGQRAVRTTVRQGDRRDSRRRNDRQADEGVLDARLPPGRLVLLGILLGGPMVPVCFMPNMLQLGIGRRRGGWRVLGALCYLMRMNRRVVDDLVVNMVDVGEETGELDTMLYKVADTYDEEVKTMTDSLMSLLEPLLDLLPGRRGRLHRDLAVHAAGGPDFKTVVTVWKNARPAPRADRAVAAASPCNTNRRDLR